MKDHSGITLIGAFPDLASAERAAEGALGAGVALDAISLLVRPRPSEPEADYASQPTITSGLAGSSHRFDPLGNDIRTSTPTPVQGGNEWPIGETAETDGTGPADSGPVAPTELVPEESAAKTASLGIGVGSIAALAATAIPGIGLAIGGGILATSLIATAAAVSKGDREDGLDRCLADRHVPAEDIFGYRDTFDRGGAILAVDTPDQGTTERVERAMRDHHADKLGRYGGHP